MTPENVKMFSPPPPSFCRANINLQKSLSEAGDVRTLPELVEYNSRRNADYPFCLQAKKRERSTSFSFHTLSHQQLKQAIVQCSSWLVENVAELKLPYRSGDGTVVKGPPVALFMDSDVGLWVYQLSLMGLGVPVLVLSPRLSSAAVHHLLVSTASRTIIVSRRLQNKAMEAMSLIPAAEDSVGLYLQTSYDTFLHDRRNCDSLQGSICAQDHYIGEADCSVFILHSSGTTGRPKPIYMSHKQLLCVAVCHSFSNDEEAQRLNLSTSPLYHAFGLVSPCLSLGVGMTFCLPPLSTVPTGATTVELLKASNAHSLMVVPSILEDIALLPNSKGITALARLQFVAFGGVSLKPTVGETLATAGVKLLNHYGTTESGPLAPIFVPTSEYDWRYFRLRKDIDMHLEPVPKSEDGVQRYKLITRPFGWETTFEIQDLLISNPKNPTSDFASVGRNDDLIVLATGKKVQPDILETSLSESELVKTAIAFGEGQLELGIIIQPAIPLNPVQYGHFKSSIWTIIVEAGNRMDAHARISSKDAIVIVPPETAIPKSDKGSIMRKEVYKMFHAEIAKAYEDLENNATDHSLHLLSIDNLEQDLKILIQSQLNWKIPASEWMFDDDFFELGMDSLQATQLRRLLLSSAPACTNLLPATGGISRDFVYLHPSITKLARAMRTSRVSNVHISHRVDEVDELVEQYSIKPRESFRKSGGGSVVLLTGSTGSLGVHLLAHLASLPDVARVICLNRPNPGARPDQDPYARQLQSVKEKGVSISQQAWQKIQVLQCNSALPFLGLKDGDYAHLINEVTCILHNAWPMDFKRKLSSFQSQFRALQNLLNLARDVHAVRQFVRPKFLFISSIAVVGQYGLVHGDRVVPEIAIDDANCTNPVGYAEAKLVCERILEKAARDYTNEIEAAYVRVGQISGSQASGFWNTDEHLAAMIRSSQEIGHLPRLEGTFSWMPVDCAAKALSELLLTTRSTDVVYHMENPIRQSWHDTLTFLATQLDLPSADLLPFSDWIERVCATSDKTADKNPAKKLARFFRADFQHMACGNVILGTERLTKISPTLQGMDTVSNETVANYVNYWRRVGFLD